MQCGELYNAAGEVQGLQQQLDTFSERLVDGLTQLEGVSSSMQQLQEQSATLADAVAVRGMRCGAGCLAAGFLNRQLPPCFCALPHNSRLQNFPAAHLRALNAPS